jgi:hypothetical protein
MRAMARPVAITLCVVLALVVAPAAAADVQDEQALAERHAPIVRLVEQADDDVCGYGEPFVPTDIDLLLEEPTVAWRSGGRGTAPIS